MEVSYLIECELAPGENKVLTRMRYQRNDSSCAIDNLYSAAIESNQSFIAGTDDNAISTLNNVETIGMEFIASIWNLNGAAKTQTSILFLIILLN